MLFSRRRVEEDLKRIRVANLTPEARHMEEEARLRDQKQIEANREGVGAKDIFAMIIAVLSLIVPYVIIFLLVAYVFFKLFAGM